MVWNTDLFALLDDLEAAAQAAYAREREAELADRVRAEYAEVSLAARLMAETGSELTLDVEGAGCVRGRLERVARGWLLVRAPGRSWAIRLDAVTTVVPAGVSPGRAVPEVAWPVVARLGFGSALRRLAEAGERCIFRLRDGAAYEGVVARVGKDFVEVAVGEPARLRVVAFHALAAVGSR